MRKLSAESWWIGRAGLPRGRGKTKNKSAVEPEKAGIGVLGLLAFEVGSLMSKTAQLWQSLGDDQIVRLRDEVLHTEGVRKLVSDDDDFLLGLALAETLDSLGFLSHSVAWLGKKCDDPVLQRFEHVFADAIKNDADLYGWEFVGKKMERKVRKMERFVATSANLYQEMEVLVELEQALRRMQVSAADPRHQGSLTEFKQKVIWQRQEVKSLQEASLWNRSYDYAVCLLARSLFTIMARIRHVFGLRHKGSAPDGSRSSSRAILARSHSMNGSMRHSPNLQSRSGISRFSSGPLPRSGTRSGPVAITDRPAVRHPTPLVPPGLPPPPGKRSRSRSTWPVSGGPFRGCMMGGNESPVLQICLPVDRGLRRPSSASDIHCSSRDADSEAHRQGSLLNTNLSLYLSISKRKLMSAPSSTLGAAGLALHYANVIIVIEKLAASPHLIGPDARDDLYHMLTTSIRASLRARLKSYAKNLASPIYDPNLAAEWNEAMERILDWMAPLAHNMLSWQSERNFEQQHLVSNTNIRLLQTLYFANQMKTEAAITELLVGLNYLWRFERELNAKAILECVSSRNLEDCMNFKF